MSTHAVNSEIIDIQGYVTFAVYVHYFMPGSLKIHTKLNTVHLGNLRDLIEFPRIFNTRRWLPKGEVPYPGYCRAPGTGKCIPTLCNCQTLLERWNMQADLIKKLKKNT